MEKAPIVSLVMAAGEGKRMGHPSRSKVCFQIDGEPVICRSLRTYEACGVTRHVVVVGHLAEQVREAVAEAEFSNVAFAMQAERRGTGHAARCGADVMEAEGYDGLVLIVAGDRVLERSALERMIGAQEQSGAGLVFLTGEVADNPTSGRVVRDASGRPVAIIEVAEIALSRLLADVEEMLADADGSICCAPLLELMQRHFPDQSKLKKVGGELYELVKEAAQVDVERVRAAVAALLPAAEIELLRDGRPEKLRAHELEDAARQVNLSVYLFASAALYDGLTHLEANNAQGEEYLTDVVKYLAGATDCAGRPRYHLETVQVAYPEESMGFNTPEELERIQAYCATK